jgi:hypothetical protein
MSDKIKRGHKVNAADIKEVLETVVHKGKLTVWNQLFMLHSQVKRVFACCGRILETKNDFVVSRFLEYRGFAATRSSKRSTTPEKHSTARINRT